ncbi:MAG: hypothetical protein ACJ8FY_11670 [Gemmataceae bacterium]
MSVGLKTGQYLYQPEEFHDPGNPLHMEFGWRAVANGLSRVLFGYFLMVLGWIIGGAALFYAVYHRELDAASKLSKQSSSLIIFFGIGFLGLASLISYGFIIAGKWRCIMNAPERHAAKWLMFLCILCLLVSPSLHLIFSLSGEGAENYRHMRQHGKEGLAELKIEGTAGAMQLVSTGLGLASTLLFVLFLRAVACCFKSQACLWNIHIFLGYACLLIGLTLQMVLSSQRLLFRPDVLLVVGAGWLLFVCWYVVVIVSVRVGITRGLSRVHSPLALGALK